MNTTASSLENVFETAHDTSLSAEEKAEIRRKLIEAITGTPAAFALAFARI